MWQKILPKSIDNVCPGNPAALWLFWFITTVTVGRSLAHILLPDGGAQSIATVPLDQFSGGRRRGHHQFRIVGSFPTAAVSGHGAGFGSLPWADSCHVRINSDGISRPHSHRSQQTSANADNTARCRGQSGFQPPGPECRTNHSAGQQRNPQILPDGRITQHVCAVQRIANMLLFNALNTLSDLLLKFENKPTRCPAALSLCLSELCLI